ncbi:MAG: SBBP repeat-containing protein [Promethearchaeota archaeon]
MKKNLIMTIILMSMLGITTLNVSLTVGTMTDSVNLDDYILCSYLGGSRDDLIRDMAVDSDGNILVTGDTMSENFPVKNDAFQSTFAGGTQDIHTVSGDAFISKFSPTGDLIWSSYLGGSRNDGGMGIHVDSEDNIYVVGITNSVDFPVTGLNNSHGGSDGFVTKFDPDGTLVFSMCIGTAGEENLEGSVMYSDILTVTGSTSMSTFPITNNAEQTIFGGAIDGTIVQLLTNGSLLYSSFFGGSGIDVIGEIYSSKDGHYIVNGYSDSVNLPFTENAYSTEISGPGRDFFIATFSNVMEIEYCTYFGGSAVDDCFGCTFDMKNNMIFSGRTWSTDFPTRNAWQSKYAGGENEVNGVDAFVTKMNLNGEVVFSSYFGGPEWDTLHFVDTDEQNNIFTCGDAPTNDFPVSTNAIQSETMGSSDVVLLALTPEGTPYFGTFFGGSQGDHVWNMELFANEVYIVGHTASNDFPTSNEAYQVTKNASNDGFFLRFDHTKYMQDYPAEPITNSKTSIEMAVIFGAIILISFRKRKE